MVDNFSVWKMAMFDGIETNITTSFQKITKQMADIILKDHMARNRKIKPESLEMFCNLLRSGEFKTTHQGIAFNSEGLLIDGQHRLLAISKTGISAEMMVTFGTDDVFWALDGGTPRNAKDVINVELNTVCSAKISECSTLIIKIGSNQFKPTKKAILEVGRLISGGVEKILTASNSRTRIISSAMGTLVCLYRISTDPKNESEYLSMYKNLATRNFEEMGSIGRAFYKQILGNNIRTSNHIDFCIRLLSVYDLAKQNMTKIQVAKNSEFPKEIKVWCKKICDEGGISNA